MSTVVNGLYAPYSLAINSSHKAKIQTLEDNFGGIVDLVGGEKFVNGVSTNVSGALAAKNLKPAPWITNAHKTEPYALLVYQGRIKQLTTGLTTRTICIPGGYGLKGALGVSFGMRFMGSKVHSGTVVVSVCGSAGQTLTYTNLASHALASATLTEVWTGSDDPATNYIKVTVTTSTGTPDMNDILVTVVVKAKHVP